MAKYAFSAAERYVVWSSHDQRCWWCEIPIGYSETTIDHVLAESLLDDQSKLDKMLVDLGLPASFQINGYENWMPAHAKCNSSKSKSDLTPSPRNAALVQRLLKDAPNLVEREKKLLSDRKKERLLGKVTIALDEGLISKEDLTAMFLESFEPSDPDLVLLKVEVELYIPKAERMKSDPSTQTTKIGGVYYAVKNVAGIPVTGAQCPGNPNDYVYDPSINHWRRKPGI